MEFEHLDNLVAYMIVMGLRNTELIDYLFDKIDIRKQEFTTSLIREHMIAFQSKKANRQQVVKNPKVAAVKDQGKKKEKGKKVTAQCNWCWKENGHRSDVCRFGPGGELHDPVKFPQKERPPWWKDKPELQVTKKKAKCVSDLNKKFEETARQSENEGTSDEENSTVERHVVNRVKVKQRVR